MDPLFTFAGFEPAQSFLGEMQDRLSQLAEFLPYDASILLHIEKNAKDYAVSAAVHFVDGKMLASSHASNLKKAIDEALDDVYQQSCAWHAERFKSEEYAKQLFGLRQNYLVVSAA